MWNWTDCDNDVDFNELWFVARGGGGGSYGIVTSLHYQLHDYPGPLQLAALQMGEAMASFDGWTEDRSYAFTVAFIEFWLRYLYLPETMNVSEADSRGCNSAMTMSLNPFSGGLSGPALSFVMDQPERQS